MSQPELVKLARRAMQNDPEGQSGDLARAWDALVAERDELRQQVEVGQRWGTREQAAGDALRDERDKALAELQRLRDALEPFALESSWHHNYDGRGVIFAPAFTDSENQAHISRARAALAREEAT